MALLCTISNNVPGSDFSLGSDTALNEITDVSYSNILYTNYYMALLCTISNNVPGSDFSLGADTALNEITDVSYSNILYTNYGSTMYHQQQCTR